MNKRNILIILSSIILALTSLYLKIFSYLFLAIFVFFIFYFVFKLTAIGVPAVKSRLKRKDYFNAFIKFIIFMGLVVFVITVAIGFLQKFIQHKEQWGLH